MKANAPEKLYLLPNGLISFCRTSDEDVEYTRTDAFIEKTIAWLNETLRNTDFYENEIELMIKDFKRYMEK